MNRNRARQQNIRLSSPFRRFVFTLETLNFRGGRQNLISKFLFARRSSSEEKSHAGFEQLITTVALLRHNTRGCATPFFC